MTVWNAATGLMGMALIIAATVATTAPAAAAPLPPSLASGLAPSSAAHAIDYRPYYHCHGPKRCHGKGNYYSYTPSDEAFSNTCRYGRGCGYNNGWNSPSARYQYTGRRWHRHRHHRRHRH